MSPPLRVGLQACGGTHMRFQAQGDLFIPPNERRLGWSSSAYSCHDTVVRISRGFDSNFGDPPNVLVGDKGLELPDVFLERY